ncbi:MAG: hypothetical protein AB7V37_05685, partial [Eubacteriaceae bacterium]
QAACLNAAGTAGTTAATKQFPLTNKPRKIICLPGLIIFYNHLFAIAGNFFNIFIFVSDKVTQTILYRRGNKTHL